MTKEDALFFLARFRTKGINEKLYDALGVAIEALNAQPSAADTNVVTTDTISRRETVKAIRDAMLAWSYMPLWREDKIVDAVKALPSAQPECKKGKWLPDNNNYYEERFICSVCGKSYKVDTCMGKPMWDFCPCGADMRGEQK